MSLLSSSKLIDIRLYYQLIKKDGHERIKVLKDDEAEKKIAKNEEDRKQFYSKIEEEIKNNLKETNDDARNKKFILNPSDEVHILNTKWKEIAWKEQNQILAECRSVNQFSGLLEVDHLKFRDKKVKTCLKNWDLKDDMGNAIPCTPEIIDQLSFEVVFSLVNKFDSIINLDDEEEKK